MTKISFLIGFLLAFLPYLVGANTLAKTQKQSKPNFEALASELKAREEIAEAMRAAIYWIPCNKISQDYRRLYMPHQFARLPGRIVDQPPMSVLQTSLQYGITRTKNELTSISELRSIYERTLEVAAEPEFRTRRRGLQDWKKVGRG